MAVTDVTPGGGMQAWLQYLGQMYGIGPDQAAAMMAQGGNPANMPSPDASNMSLVTPPNPGGFNIPPGPGMPPVSPPAPLPPATPPGPLAAGGMPARPAGVSATGLRLQPGSLSPASLAYFGGRGIAPWPSGGGSIGPGMTNPDVASPNAQPTSAATPPVNPAATGGAGGQGAMSNPRFVQIDRPNAPAGGSPYGRGGPPQMTALNLAGLFGGGGPGATGGPAAAPQGVRGPLASGSSGISMADLYPAAAARGQTPGPFNISSADLYPAAAAAQGMPGRQPMNPNQLASAVRQPNWWQNLFGQG